MAKEEVKKKEKRPTAKKRDIQSKKRNVANRGYKATVNTTIRALEKVIESGDAEAARKSLSEVYSIVDKGVKRGRYKQNKANRIKAKLTKRASVKAS